MFRNSGYSPRFIYLSQCFGMHAGDGELSDWVFNPSASNSAGFSLHQLSMPSPTTPLSSHRPLKIKKKIGFILLYTFSTGEESSGVAGNCSFG